MRLMNAFVEAAVHTIVSAVPDQLGARDLDWAGGSLSHCRGFSLADRMADADPHGCDSQGDARF